MVWRNWKGFEVITLRQFFFRLHLFVYPLLFLKNFHLLFQNILEIPRGKFLYNSYNFCHLFHFRESILLIWPSFCYSISLRIIFKIMIKNCSTKIFYIQRINSTKSSIFRNNFKTFFIGSLTSSNSTLLSHIFSFAVLFLFFYILFSLFCKMLFFLC